MVAGDSHAQDECSPPVAPKAQTVAQYVDEGFRPLQQEELESLQSGKPQTSTDWRPSENRKDCEPQPSLLEPEERGYRPLDYATQQYQSRQESSGARQPPGIGYPGEYWRYSPPAYQNSYPYYSPTYPTSPGGYGQPGGFPNFTQPPRVPGYGIMPYSFGGSTTAPY